MSIVLWAQEAVFTHVIVDWDRFMQVRYLGRAPRTKETLSDFLKWRRVTRHPLVFRELTSSQRTLGFWGVTRTVEDVCSKGSQTGPCGCDRGGGMIEEFCPSCTAKMPLENSSPLEGLLCLRLWRSNRKGMSSSTFFIVVLVEEIDEAEGERAEEPDCGRKAEEGD